MAEYIEREALVKEISDIGHTAPMTYAGGLALALNSVRSAPTADVAPVRHGRWIEDSDPGQEIGTAWRCSSCGLTIGMKKVEKDWHHYCPNCGAKMDKEEE